MSKSPDCTRTLFDIVGDTPFDRLCELIKADKDGRCLILPCKEGSDVWVVLPEYTECSVSGERYNDEYCAGCESDKCDSELIKVIKRIKNVSLISLGGWIAHGCFGKTVFLTRAEAEKSLEETIEKGE